MGSFVFIGISFVLFASDYDENKANYHFTVTFGMSLHLVV